MTFFIAISSNTLIASAQIKYMGESENGLILWSLKLDRCDNMSMQHLNLYFLFYDLIWFQIKFNMFWSIMKKISYDGHLMTIA